MIEDGIARRGTPAEFVLVSAFASLPTVLRIKPKIEAAKAAGGDVRLVLGVDLGGTSKQVLQEVASWGVPVTIVKNRIVGVTFHPKVYLLRWSDQVEIFVGSNNLTEGGFYKNSEATTRTKYNLPADAGPLAKGLQELERFLNPSGPTAALLTPSYLASLLALPEIPSEAEARRKRGEAMARKPSQNQPNTVFGSEPVNPPPNLPAELQVLLLAAREHQQSEFKRAVARAKRQAAQAAAGQPPVNPTLISALPSPLAQVDPNYFYMTLPAMQKDNPNIPGEPRIPLEARDLAEDFWGWPDNYDRSISPRKGAAAKEPRVYRNWHPVWRIFAADDPSRVVRAPVRMYFYENSSDFRFYTNELNRLGAASGDIVRLQRVDDAQATYECALARAGSPEHAAWSRFLFNKVKASERRWGFA